MIKTILNTCVVIAIIGVILVIVGLVLLGNFEKLDDRNTFKIFVFGLISTAIGTWMTAVGLAVVINYVIWKGWW